MFGVCVMDKKSKHVSKMVRRNHAGEQNYSVFWTEFVLFANCYIWGTVTLMTNQNTQEVRSCPFVALSKAKFAENSTLFCLVHI